MRIYLYGRLADGIGREMDIDLLGRPTLAAVRAEIARLHPAAEADMRSDRARACVNDRIANDSRIVEPSDEVGFLPPLSGG